MTEPTLKPLANPGSLSVTPEAIVAYRQQNSLTQQKLAEILGVGIATVNRWERGEAKPTGTVEIVLKAALFGAAVAATGFAAYGIYSILKKAFEPTDDKAGKDD